MERLGLGPAPCHQRNPRLVYGRMTGWGQEGPYAQMAGHDINYISLGGALAHIGRAGAAPVPPLNLIGDFGGGGMLLAFGVACGLVEAKTSGKGQVVDAAMVDGSAILMAMFAGMFASGAWSTERGANLLDSGSHFYDVYETKDGQYVSFGSIEPQFYAELLELSGLGAQGDLPNQMDKAAWPQLKERLAALVKQKTRDEWCQVMEGSDVCFAPVLTYQEAARHPHNVHRSTFVEVAGITQPAPAPRFSRTEVAVGGPPAWPGQHTDEVLAGAGLSADEIAKLRESGAVA
jgi:alpha-methylacyl-CoA racemase